MLPEWTQNAIAINLSRELAVMYGLVEPTPEERAEQAEWSRKHEAETRESWRIYGEARPKLAAITDPVARAVLDLHHADREVGPTCQGCDMEGYECEAPEWPCRTVEAVAEVYGIPMPQARHLWRRPTEAP